jgi:fido (protein-threonine AMPylation protein)
VATFEQKLNGSLARLESVTRGGRAVFAARELGRVHRDRLITAGHLQRIIGGWMLRTPPGLEPDDGTHFWAAYWTFCAAYCESRFGTDWHLSADQSLLLHVEDTVVPASLVVCSPKGQNNDLALLHGTSLYDLREATLPPAEDIWVRQGLRLYTLDAALVKVPESFYVAHPLEAQLALRAVPDASGLLRRLLRTGQPIVAGRLAGAFRHVGRVDLTEELLTTMRSAGHAPVEKNPFTAPRLPISLRRGTASIAARLAGLAALGRASLVDQGVRSPGRVTDPNAYLESLMARHADDAFHGLWLDGLVVTREAIAQADEVGAPSTRRGDVRDLALLTARGDLQAFRAVTRAIGAILAGAPVTDVLREAHREWYREFLQPRVAARLLPVAALAGYREDRVYLSGSRFVPPEPQAMRAAMPALFDLLDGESDPFFRAVLARWLVSYLHPYREGNERMAHFLMNALLAAGGWQWRTLEGTDQGRYRDALDRAHLSCDLRPLAALIKADLRPADALRSEAIGAWSITPEPPVAAAATPAEQPVQEAHVEPVVEPSVVPAIEAARQGTPEAGGNTAEQIEPSLPASESTPTGATPAGSPTSRKRKRQYAPMPTQMGLFGE